MGIERKGRCPQNPTVEPGGPPKNLESALSEGGLQIWGDVKFRSDAVLQGKVRGGVESTEKIIVSAGALVSGAVQGTAARVEGEVQGGVSTSGQVWICPGGKVRVRCRGKSVRMEPGADFRGELDVG